MDPQQRLLLEAAHTAFTNSGRDRDQLMGADVGVPWSQAEEGGEGGRGGRKMWCRGEGGGHGRGGSTWGAIYGEQRRDGEEGNRGFDHV